jgi:nicotinamidase-related amidase
LSASLRAGKSASALLLVDFIHPLLGRGGFARATLRAAQHAAVLSRRMRRTGVPLIYANDHFGNWRSDFAALLDKCRGSGGCAREVLALLEPTDRDFAVLKPRHSAFYGTPLEFLLDDLGIERLVLAGIEADICILHTAQDAHMRKLKLWVPRNCVASKSQARLAAALDFMKANLGADTRPAKARG